MEVSTPALSWIPTMIPFPALVAGILHAESGNVCGPQEAMCSKAIWPDANCANRATCSNPASKAPTRQTRLVWHRMRHFECWDSDPLFLAEARHGPPSCLNNCTALRYSDSAEAYRLIGKSAKKPDSEST